MEIANFSIEEFLGIIFVLPFLMYFIIVIFDGIGMFKEIFRPSRRRPRK
jgi:hypothetical protein